MFTPWEGDHYGASDNFPATLILGESHYGEDYPFPDKTIRCIRTQIEGRAWRFFTRVAASFLGHLPSREEKASFWHSVAYHNLITTPLRGPRMPPSAEQWAASLPTLESVLSDLRPGLVVVLGKRMWWQVGGMDCLADVAAQCPPGMLPPKRLKGDGTIFAAITHPSGRGFTWVAAHAHVEWAKRLALGIADPGQPT
jgi:hypothetical protein